jgi:hypothetical protein
MRSPAGNGRVMMRRKIIVAADLMITGFRETAD